MLLLFGVVTARITLDLLFKFTEKSLHYSRAIKRERNLTSDNTLDLALDLAYRYSLKIHNDKENSPFIFDFSTSNIVIFANIFTILQPKERSNERIEKLNLILKHWIKVTKQNNSIYCPVDPKSNLEWMTFRKKIEKLGEDFLGIPLDIVWPSTEYQTSQIYIQANHFFYECLQVATVENREAIEDMILKAPDDNE